MSSSRRRIVTGHPPPLFESWLSSDWFLLFVPYHPTEMPRSFLQEQSFQLKGQAKLLQHSLRPPKSKFTPDQLPDLSGRVMLVTGRC